MILSSVFFLSFSALAFEILLARLFSISQWNNLYFMVISVALLGFASGGVLFFFLDTRIPGWETRWSEKGPLAFLLLGFTASALLSLFVLSKIPFDYFRLPFEPVQGLYLLALYLMLGAVFFFCGLAVMIGYAALPEKSGRVYFASMAGSACGAAAAIPLLSFFGETGAAALSVLPPLIPAAGDCLKGFAGRPAGLPDAPDPKYGKLTVLPSAFLIALAAYFVFFGDPPLARVGPSPYKALSQALQFPDTRVFKEASSIYGRVDCLESPHLRHAPGLSLKFPDAAPGQWTAFRDGDHPLGFYPKDGDPAFARSTLQYAGYVLRPDPDRVLVLQTGGGTAIPCALASGARQIIAVETHPDLAHLLQAHYGIEVVWEAPRAYLAQTGASFDVIHLENWGPSLPGTAALNPDALLTVEAFGACLNRLSPTGILMVSRRLRLPPGDTLRLWSTAHAALSRAGVSDPGRHLLVLRNWDTFALIVSRPPLPDLGPVVDFARRLNFDFVFASPPVTDPVNRYNRFPEAYYHQALAELAAAHRKGREDAFFDAYLLDVEPRADDRPYPDRFIKYGRILDLYRSTGSRFFTLFMSGEILVSVVLLEAAAISALLLLLPVFSLHRKKKKRGEGFRFFSSFFCWVLDSCSSRWPSSRRSRSFSGTPW